jgi:hypothetical protein
MSKCEALLIVHAANEVACAGVPVVLTDGGGGEDRAWFEQHPHRAYRLRPVLDDDPAPAGCAYVIARRVCKGVRSRLFSELPGIEAAVDSEDDGLLALLWRETIKPVGCSVSALMLMRKYQVGGQQ